MDGKEEKKEMGLGYGIRIGRTVPGSDLGGP